MELVQKQKIEITCPVCGLYDLKDEYDICHVCFWENDLYQYNNPNSRGGANHLSLNDYKKWWQCLERLMPKLIEKYKVKQSKKHFWKYDNLLVPKRYISMFEKELADNNIEFEQKLNSVRICPNPNHVPKV